MIVSQGGVHKFYLCSLSNGRRVARVLPGGEKVPKRVSMRTFLDMSALGYWSVLL